MKARHGKSEYSCLYVNFERASFRALPKVKILYDSTPRLNSIFSYSKNRIAYKVTLYNKQYRYWNTKNLCRIEHKGQSYKYFNFRQVAKVNLF